MRDWVSKLKQLNNLSGSKSSLTSSNENLINNSQLSQISVLVTNYYLALPCSF